MSGIFSQPLRLSHPVAPVSPIICCHKFFFTFVPAWQPLEIFTWHPAVWRPGRPGSMAYIHQPNQPAFREGKGPATREGRGGRKFPLGGCMEDFHPRLSSDDMCVGRVFYSVVMRLRLTADATRLYVIRDIRSNRNCLYSTRQRQVRKTVFKAPTWLVVGFSWVINYKTEPFKMVSTSRKCPSKYLQFHSLKVMKN